MNREIKFRGMAPYTGWEYGSLVTTESGDSFIIPDYVNNEDEIHSEIQSVDPKTVGQYTGKKDKNGTEIYFGDKIMFADKWEWYGREYISKLIFGQITKEEAIKRVEDRPYYTQTVESIEDYEWLLSDEIERYWEVYGNIHENPELL